MTDMVASVSYTRVALQDELYNNINSDVLLSGAVIIESGFKQPTTVSYVIPQVDNDYILKYIRFICSEIRHGVIGEAVKHGAMMSVHHQGMNDRAKVYSEIVSSHKGEPYIALSPTVYTVLSAGGYIDDSSIMMGVSGTPRAVMDSKAVFNTACFIGPDYTVSLSPISIEVSIPETIISVSYSVTNIEAAHTISFQEVCL
jgi:hypothetical protein